MTDTASTTRMIEDENPNKDGETKLQSTKTRVAVGILVLIVAVGGILAYLYAHPSKEIFTGPVEKLRVGNVGEYTIFNIIAQKQGFFEEQGLDVTITEYSSGPASIGALLEGKEDFSIAADFVGVRNIFTNSDIRILAQVNTHRVFQLVARTDRIRTLEDIRGKRIGVTKNSAGEYFLGNFLTFNNIDLANIVMVDQTPVEMLAGLEDGSIDAIVLFEPHIYNIQKEFGDTVTMWDLQQNQTTNAVLYSTQNYLDAHPEVASRYMHALVKAEQYYNENMADALMIVGDILQLDSDYQEYVTTRLIHTIGLNHELLINMESQARWSIQNKLTDATEVPNFLTHIYPTALEEIKPESVTVIR